MISSKNNENSRQSQFQNFRDLLQNNADENITNHPDYEFFINTYIFSPNNLARNTKEKFNSFCNWLTSLITQCGLNMRLKNKKDAFNILNNSIQVEGFKELDRYSLANLHKHKAKLENFGSKKYIDSNEVENKIKQTTTSAIVNFLRSNFSDMIDDEWYDNKVKGIKKQEKLQEVIQDILVEFTYQLISTLDQEDEKYQNNEARDRLKNESINLFQANNKHMFIQAFSLDNRFYTSCFENIHTPLKQSEYKSEYQSLIKKLQSQVKRIVNLKERRLDPIELNKLNYKFRNDFHNALQLLKSFSDESGKHRALNNDPILVKLLFDIIDFEKTQNLDETCFSLKFYLTGDCLKVLDSIQGKLDMNANQIQSLKELNEKYFTDKLHHSSLSINTHGHKSLVSLNLRQELIDYDKEAYSKITKKRIKIIENLFDNRKVYFKNRDKDIKTKECLLTLSDNDHEEIFHRILESVPGYEYCILSKYSPKKVEELMDDIEYTLVKGKLPNFRRRRNAVLDFFLRAQFIFSDGSGCIPFLKKASINRHKNHPNRANTLYGYQKFKY